MLGHSAQAAAGTVDWVRQHRLRLQETYHKALDQWKQAAADRTRYTDMRAADYALHVGDHVYVRNRVLGRNKIQNFWRPELHRVTSRPFDGQHVYMIQPLAGRAELAVHRKDLMPATTPLVASLRSFRCTAPEGPYADHQPQPPSPDDSDSESDSDDELSCVDTSDPSPRCCCRAPSSRTSN